MKRLSQAFFRGINSCCLGIAAFVLVFSLNASAQHEQAPRADSTTQIEATEVHEGDAANAHEEEGQKGGRFDPTDMILNHIANSNEFHLWGHVAVPLPCILYSKEDGFTNFFSSKLHHGEKAFNRYVLDHGVVRRVLDPSFPSAEVEVGHVRHEKVAGGEIGYLTFEGKEYQLEKATTLLAGTSFYDFSISKNVFSMLLSGLLLLWIFISVSRKYKKRGNVAPKGLQNFMEIMVQFIIDEVAKPMLGKNYQRFLPFILTIFFFILVNNFLGLIPIFPGGANITGNLSTTLTLALFTFFITLFNSKSYYWQHILWMPGVPVPMKLFLAPIEIMGIFIKPISLMIRLFANITAGHIIILSLVGLIFVFGNAGESLGGGIGGALVAIPFTLFMNVIEIIVGLIQAFIFAILSASYFGAALEEGHGEHH
ncbi:MAG: F0F1 ATP synthase subunit A [Saprospiraceae bacterium]